MSLLATPVRHVYGIDIIRFLAAVGVAGFHFTWKDDAHAADCPWGWVGVEVFFVVSGFVIAGAAQGSNPASFAFNRFLRLYPAAWICGLTGAIVLLWLHLAGYPYPRPATLTVGSLWGSMALVSDAHIATAYWTLPVEIAFYALVACLMSRPNPGVAAARLLAAISAPYFLCLVLDQAGIVAAPWTDLGYGLANMLLVRHGPYFVVGLFIHRWIAERRGLAGLDWGLFGLVVALSLAGIVVRAHQLAPLYAGPVDWRGLAATASAIFAAAVVALGIATAFNERLSPPAGARSALRAIGLMTYPYYLLHEIVGLTIMLLAAKAGLSFMAGLGSALTSVGLVSYLVVRAEGPARRAIRRAVVLGGERLRLWRGLSIPAAGRLRERGRRAA